MLLSENPYRSPQPNDRATRVSERGSGISPALQNARSRRCFQIVAYPFQRSQ
ncbi:hypothetical protein GOR03_004766 [Salmonella enterica]|nr:hypothetical protein [Salmonella enterica subsp. enterica serovar Thompson]EDQ1662056.1 hypothetical protein [Salmonella enterica subsp. enterica serovar Livingstone]EDR4437696.1 hypothetical protein [Salmonella enterica subsp. enterica serovar Braenderup]EDR6148143.1 hypothetical protein [Salmonella enterica subsp. enterica serovar Oranienburg]EDR7851069.1 hypothetical protein [Salmonella enterica]EDR9898890.1 hypothetical protein [Salmonella enterica subsp. enterica serovar Ohio]EDS29690